MNPHIPTLYSIPRHRANIDHAKERAMEAFTRGQNYCEIAGAIGEIPTYMRKGAVQRLFSNGVHASREAFQLHMRLLNIPLFYNVPSMEKWCNETRKMAAKLMKRCDTARGWLMHDPTTGDLIMDWG